MTIPGVYQLDVGKFRKNPPDQTLIARLGAGDSDALKVLMRRHNQRLYRVCRSILPNDLEAEDAVQEAYLRAYRGLSGFRGEPEFAVWLTKIAAHEALSRQGRPPRFVPFEPPADWPPAEEQAVADGLGEPLARAIDSLPANYRTVFVLRHVQEISAEETAACLNLTVEAVETRLLRARRMLQQNLPPHVIDNGARRVFSFGGPRSERLIERTQQKLLNAASLP